MAKLSLEYIEEAAVDIEAFSRFEFMKVVIIVYSIRKQENKKKSCHCHYFRHAKRTSVNSDDVKLLARKNPGLEEHLKKLKP